MYFTSEREKKCRTDSLSENIELGKSQASHTKEITVFGKVLLVSVCLTLRWGEVDQCQPRKIGTACVYLEANTPQMEREVGG